MATLNCPRKADQVGKKLTNSRHRNHATAVTKCRGHLMWSTSIGPF